MYKKNARVSFKKLTERQEEFVHACKYCNVCMGYSWRRDPSGKRCKCGEVYEARKEVTVASRLDSGELSLASPSIFASSETATEKHKGMDR